MNLEKGGHVYVQQRMFQAPHGLLNHIPDGLGHLWKVAPNWKTSREGKGTVQRVLSLKGGLEAKASLSEHRAPVLSLTFFAGNTSPKKYHVV